MAVKVGVIGTSWWADAMYLPALKSHPQAEVAAVCGRNAQSTQTFAARWGIPGVYTDPYKLIEQSGVDALVVATANDTHYPITMKAIEAGLHVLCEKPLGLNYGEATRMADAAEAKGIKHLVPFTYSYMPTARYLKELIDGGYIGQPYHLNLRYYTGYGRDGSYMWRFDVGKAGAGSVGDIGSHFMYIARWLYGEITGVYCRLGTFTQRPPLDSNGKPYEQGDDTAILTLQFESGAQGVIHVTTMCYEDSKFGQIHQMEFHGSGGTLHSFTDWDKIQQVSGAKVGEGMVKELPIPEHIWNGVRRDTVHHTYKDVFRTQDFMARQWLTGIVEDKPLKPDFHDGAAIQRVIDAALKSNREQCWVQIAEIQMGD